MTNDLNPLEMAPVMRKTCIHKPKQTRDRILQEAIRHFSDCGYAAASVQKIATSAQVTKPTLYYHFGSKAGLFRVLTDLAEGTFEELVVYAAARAPRLRDQLVEVCASLFEFAVNQREVVRLALGYSAVSRGEVPPRAHCPEKVHRRVAVIGKLMQRGLLDGTLRPHLKSVTLASCFLGLIQCHVMLHLATPEGHFTRAAARELVGLFLDGAGVHDRPAATPRKGGVA